jgi:hypothetical protein
MQRILQELSVREEINDASDLGLEISELRSAMSGLSIRNV